MTPIVQTRALTKTFGRRRGIVDVDLEIAKGEIFGFLGPNGAGKSTTMRILMGLCRATSGTARVLGLDPFADASAVHARVGYLPGELALFPALTGQAHLDRFAAIRGLTDTHYRDALVRRFDVDLSRPVRVLSKGNRQKIGVVAAFMHRPDLVVLDEPTSGLDPLLRDEFASLVRETAEDGRTVMLSSHVLDEVQRLVDRVAIIREGRLVVTDTVAALRATVPRTMELRFASTVDSTALDELTGVTVTHRRPEAVTLSVTGEVAPVLRTAADLGAVDLTARPADLEELFLGYYRLDGPQDVTEDAGVA